MTTLDKNSNKNYRTYKKLAKSIVRSNELDEKDLVILEDGLKTKENLNVFKLFFEAVLGFSKNKEKK